MKLTYFIKSKGLPEYIARGQANMQNNIFRQKNIDKINSPEKLNDYVKVTNPSVWLILIGTIVLIAGALIFCIFGTVDTNVNVAVLASDGAIMAYVDEGDAGRISPDMKIDIGGVTYSIDSIAKRPLKSSEIDEYLLHKCNMEESQWIFPVAVEGTLQDGIYVGSITVEEISLISYVFN